MGRRGNATTMAGGSATKDRDTTRKRCHGFVVRFRVRSAVAWQWQFHGRAMVHFHGNAHEQNHAMQWQLMA